MAKDPKAQAATTPPATSAELAQGLVALRRIDHDGLRYGPGEPQGEELPPMPRAVAEALLACGAAAEPAGAAPADAAA